MKHSNLLKIGVVLLFFLTSCSKSWDYKHQDNWSKKYPDCAGKYQSPIDIKSAVQDTTLKPLFIDYYITDSTVVKNTGKTVKLSHLKGSVATPDTSSFYGHVYYLANIHFHTPSEHTVNGKHYDGEIHFVNVDTAGNIMVLAVFMSKGNANPGLDLILKNTPKGHEKNILPKKFDPNLLLPNSSQYWHYAGSLTTPPCTEGVQWYILKKPIEISQTQLDILQTLMGKNNRDTKPLNGRIITEF